MENLRQKFATWMRGRRGPDDLARASLYLACALIIINIFLKFSLLSYITLVLTAYSLFRTFSKNLAARSRENAAFLKRLGPARRWLQNPRAALAEGKAYKHVTCPSCSQRIRVPRNKGKIRVTCPKCRTKFAVRS